MGEPAASAHIVLRVGEVNCRSILATTYGIAGNPFGEAMRVCLEHGEPTGREGEKTITTGERLVKAMPDMWRHLADFLDWHSHHGVDEAKDARRIARSWATLARRIYRVLDRVGNHPAYRGKSILGVDRTVLSAWWTEPDNYWITAVDALAHSTNARHGLLIPKITIIAGRSVTTWQWRPTSDQTGLTAREVPPDPRWA